jgi:hypothetical protein
VTVGGSTTDGGVHWINLGTQAAYKLVNETNPDDDSSYLSDATVSDQARFTYPAVAGSGVLAVAAYARARKDDAGVRSIRLVAKSGGTVGDNGSDLAQSSTYQYFRGLFETEYGFTVDGCQRKCGRVWREDDGVTIRAGPPPPFRWFSRRCGQPGCTSEIFPFGSLTCAVFCEAGWLQYAYARKGNGEAAQVS